MSGISKRVSGSWVSGDYGILKTATDTITTLPVVLYPNDTTATVSLKGNTTQNGTPTPDSPIMPEGTGERTGNLFPLDESKLHVGRIENDGTIDYEIGTLTVGTDSVTYEVNVAWRGFYTDFIQVNENEKLTFSPNNNSIMSWACKCYDENGGFLGNAFAQPTPSIVTFTLLTGTKKVRMSVTSSNTTYTILRPMLNSGSTALPYEPYGYKLDISSSNTTTSVYLGEVETTRRVNKLVLTGREDWYGSAKYRIALRGQIGTVRPFCTHYIGSTVTGYSLIQNGEISVNGETARTLFIYDATHQTSIEDWKSYLAAQYAAGTPVIVWYVLAEPETAVVNEPLMKIGEYADTVSGITIPTIAGANAVDVLTTLKPSEVTVNYKGWHPVADVHERDNGAWT